ncbi:MAG: hypothetical protein L6246_09165 [Thermodesulfovibrionales bacterium]|nr:hypothetical protein [Thermodesulfovibrionales bacterium]
MRCLLVSIFLISLFLVGCATPLTSNEASPTQPSPFTHGNVQLTIRQNITTQAEILEKFGPPNIATVDSSGKEVWTYQKHATVSKSSETNAYGTVILFGVAGGSSGFEQSTRTMTLIIKFDENKKVADFKSMTTSF